MVFPIAALNQARGLAGQFQGQFTQMKKTFQLSVLSATLPTAQQLEKNLLSRNPSSVPQISGNYAALYGAVMPATDAPPQVRDLVDMTDAAAQAAMKRAIEIDALADLELQAADQINQSVQTAAPGSAPIIEAQADAWLVRANAYSQAATADLMRVRARITDPAPGAIIPAGTYTVRGKAWSGTGPVAAVHVSLTGASDWYPARLDPPKGPYQWQDWSFEWTAEGSGRKTLRARAT